VEISMNHLISLFSVATCIMAISSPTEHRRTLKVPADYPTISAAISAANPGDTVKVANGVYREQVIIDIPIRVVGTDPERTIIDGENTNDLVNVGQVRIVAGGDVEFSKFTILNAGRPDEFATRTAIYTESPVAGVNYAIHRTRSIGSNDPTQSFPVRPDHGLYSEGGREHLLFHDNEISQTGAAAIYLLDHVGPTTISDNRLRLPVGDSDCIAIYGGAGVDVTTPQVVWRNDIDLGTPTSPGFPSGLSIVSEGSGDFADIYVARNVIRNVLPNRRGITLLNLAAIPANNFMRGTIENNRILGAGGYTGISLWGYMEDVIVRRNQISGITGEGIPPSAVAGIRARGAFGLGPVRCEIYENQIEGLRGITLEADSSLNRVYRNVVIASGFPAVDLGPETSDNTVTDNRLRTPSARGNAAVLDQGVGNTVDDNR
jgi:hypothetical protein